VATRLLNIKIKTPPLGAGILSRPLLEEDMQRDLKDGNYFTRQLTLISAPAGFGKTTLARQFIAGRNEPYAWFSIDKGDNERSRFWRYLVSALQAVRMGLGKGTLEMEESLFQSSDADGTAETFLAPLLNDLLDMDEPAILVLDDYHLVDNPAINKDMEFFIENLPPTLHLVVTTRSEPPWPLARWRARGQMAEVRQKDLRFSLDESSHFFSRIKGCNLRENELETLYGKTEGWITGLQLAAISLINTDNVQAFINTFAGNSRHVFHFLGDEVFNSQPDDVREFLIKTSILERFNASLCNAVTGIEKSAELIKKLETSNIFLFPLDEQGIWYRYHPLFADLLLHHLKESGSRVLEDLHQKASSWFLKEEEPGEALRYSLKAGNQLQSARLLDDNIDRILLSEGAQLIIECLDSFPDQVLKEYPRLIVHKAWFLLVQQGKEASQQPLELADNLAGNTDSSIRDFQGMLSVVKAYSYIYSHDFINALQEAEKALKLLPADSYYWRAKIGIISGDARLFAGNPKGAYPYYCEAKHNNQAYGNSYLVISAGFKIATTLYFLGRLGESEKMIEDLLRLAEDEGLANAPRIGLLWTLKGEIYREKGKLKEAELNIENGLLISEPEKPSFSWNSLFKTALHFSNHKYQSALETIDNIKKLHSKYALPEFILLPAAFWRARALLVQGKTAMAEEELRNIGIHPEVAEIKGGSEAGHLILCRILMSKPGTANTYNAGRLLEMVENVAREGENKHILMEALLIKAILKKRSGDLDGADRELMAALEEGYVSGYYQVFLDEGRTLQQIVKSLLSSLENNTGKASPDLNDFIRNIYRDLTIAGQQKKSSKEEGQQPENLSARQQAALKEGELSAGRGPVENLSERELEILELLGRGMSNQQIAEELFLSLGTVKWHTSNIYSKMEVKSRAQAVALARSYNLIN